MEWLTTPPQERKPDSQAKLATELGVSARSIRDWMSKKDFREDWDREAKEIVGSPERAQQVLDTLFEAAIDKGNRSHVQAAKLYLEATNAITPPPIKVEVSKPSELSDAELDALLAQGAAELRKERDSRPDAQVVPIRRERPSEHPDAERQRGTEHLQQLRDGELDEWLEGDDASD
jgi:hypothetical protein